MSMKKIRRRNKDYYRRLIADKRRSGRPVCAVFSSKNAAVSLEETVNAAKSGIDVQLTNRFNKFHELAACVWAFYAHENGWLE